MANSFGRYRYTTDNATNFKLRIDNSTFSSQTTTPVAGAASDPTIRFTTSTRKPGIKVRHLILTREGGTAPNIKVYYTRLAILLPADVATMKAVATFTLNGVVWTNKNYVPEIIS